MASVNKVICPTCRATYQRTKKQINQVVKRSGRWRCQKCVLTDRNKRNARPIGATRVHRQSGYVEEKTENGCQRQHIAAMERHLGRRLVGSEIVHHKNEVKSDNRISNLEVMDHGQHTALHHTGVKRSPEKSENIRVATRAREANKLSMCAAEKIRRIYKTEGVSQRLIAERFGVTAPTINRVVLNKAWC